MKMTSATRSRHGFTFVELLLTIVIMLIMTSVAAIQFRKTYGQLAVDGVAKSLYALTAYLQGRAISQRSVFRMALSDDARAVSTMCRQAEVFSPLTGRFSGGLTAPEGITFAMSSLGTNDRIEALCFFPDGSSEGARIVVRDSAGHERSVVIQGMTGAITID